jgi:hypothetical protein
MFHGRTETRRGRVRRIDVAVEERRGAVMSEGMDGVAKAYRDDVTLVAHKLGNLFQHRSAHQRDRGAHEMASPEWNLDDGRPVQASCQACAAVALGL